MPIPLLLAASAASLAGDLVKGGIGISQGARARRLAKTKRPSYQIPGAVQENVDISRGAYNASSRYGLPGQGRIQDRQNQTTANSINEIERSQQSPTAMLGGIVGVDQNSKNSIADLGVNAANYRAGQMNQTRGQLMGANSVLGQYQDRKADWEQRAPYLATMAAASALRNSSQQNIQGAISSIGNTIGGDIIRLGEGQKGINPQVPQPMSTTAPDAQSFPPNYAQQIQTLRAQYPWMSDQQFYSLFGNNNG